MKEKREFTWRAFWIRQFKMYISISLVCGFLWNSIAIGEWGYELFGETLDGYGPPQQRWHRVIASGFFVWGVIITIMDLIGTWHHIQNPDEIPKDDNK